MGAKSKDLGIFPTPEYIVTKINQIVLHILQKQAILSSGEKSIRILDNSVGDGRFLFNFAQNWMIPEEKANNSPELHLFGIDIDSYSINLCKTKQRQFKGNNNIKFHFKEGNSLLGYIKRPKELERYKSIKELNNYFLKEFNINKLIKNDKLSFFHWFHEFKDAIDGKGFDICIGNPPFGINYSQSLKKLYKKLYTSVDPEVESYILFVERSISLLNNEGILAMLIPNNFTTNLRYKKFRRFILDNLKILQIINLDLSTFNNASVETCVLIGLKIVKGKKNQNNKIDFLSFNKKKGLFVIGDCIQNEILKSEQLHIGPFVNSINSVVINRIRKNSIPLGEIVQINRGIELGFTSDDTSDKIVSEKSVKLVAGRNINPFTLQGSTRYIEFDSDNKRIFKDRSIYEKPKILLRRIGHKLMALYDPNYLFCVCDVYLLSLKPQWKHLSELYLVSLLNSPVLNFYLNQQFRSVKTIFPKIPIEYLKQLPIVIADSAQIINEINELTSMVEDHPDETTIQMIFKKVYEIYGLFDKDRSDVEDFFEKL